MNTKEISITTGMAIIGLETEARDYYARSGHLVLAAEIFNGRTLMKATWVARTGDKLFLDVSMPNGELLRGIKADRFKPAIAFLSLTLNPGIKTFDDLEATLEGFDIAVVYEGVGEPVDESHYAVLVRKTAVDKLPEGSGMEIFDDLKGGWGHACSRLVGVEGDGLKSFTGDWADASDLVKIEDTFGTAYHIEGIMPPVPWASINLWERPDIKTYADLEAALEGCQLAVVHDTGFGSEDHVCFLRQTGMEKFPGDLTKIPPYCQHLFDPDGGHNADSLPLAGLGLTKFRGWFDYFKSRNELDNILEGLFGAPQSLKEAPKEDPKEPTEESFAYKGMDSEDFEAELWRDGSKAAIMTFPGEDTALVFITNETLDGLGSIDDEVADEEIDPDWGYATDSSLPLLVAKGILKRTGCSRVRGSSLTVSRCREFSLDKLEAVKAELVAVLAPKDETATVLKFF